MEIIKRSIQILIKLVFKSLFLTSHFPVRYIRIRIAVGEFTSSPVLRDVAISY
jgi:hypothetical protein